MSPLFDHAQSLDGFVREHLGVRLIVFDPLTAYLGGGNKAKIGGGLAEFLRIAEAREVTVVGTVHLGPKERRSAVDALADTPLAHLASAVWRLRQDPRHPGSGLLLPEKLEVVRPTALRYTVNERVLRLDPKPIDDPESAAAALDPRSIGPTVEWLEAQLGVASRTDPSLRSAARAEGFTRSMLARAKAQLGVLKRRTELGVFWTLPVDGR